MALKFVFLLYVALYNILDIFILFLNNKIKMAIHK
jgi:hypothetical protein